MKTKIKFYLVLLALIPLFALQAHSQALTGYNFRLVNMIPNAQSNEITFDSETNVAVNPSNTNSIVGSAFTRNPTGATTSAPIYVSANGGTTWALSNVVPSGNGMTGDISIDFGRTSNMLYTGILRGGSSLRCMVLRTNNPGSGVLMTTLLDRNTVDVDQPYVSATTVNDGGGVAQDRVFIGDNNLDAANGRTAEIMVSNTGTAPAPAGFNNRIIEVRNTNAQDFPPIRTAIHSSGVVYGIFYRWISGNPPSGRCDVVVVRDNNFASGATQFAALTDPSDALAGRLVVTNRLVPAFSGAALGNNRLVGSNMSIAVDPNAAATVFIAWCDRVGASDYTLHVRRSVDSGQNWGAADILTVTNATNPSIAIANNGKVAIMYQQLVGSGGTARWETHFRMASILSASYSDNIISSFLASDLLPSTISPSLGDYLKLQAVGNSFYAVFPASNNPAAANWPLMVPTYQRNVNFGTGQLRNLANTANVAVSVDPYFLKVSPQLFVNICQIHPIICQGFLVRDICRFPPFPCFRCPGPPCLSCPFDLPFEDIIREVLKDKPFETKLATPYFHLFLDGYNPETYTLAVVDENNDAVPFSLARTEKGYALSFRPSKANYDLKRGLHGLKLQALPFDEAAAKKGSEFGIRLEVSDYKLKQHLQQRM